MELWHCPGRLPGVSSKVVVIDTLEEFAQAFTTYIEPLLIQNHNKLILGFDAEWVDPKNYLYGSRGLFASEFPPFERLYAVDPVLSENARLGKVAVIQLSLADGLTFLIRVCRFHKLPDPLVMILEHPDIYKVGIDPIGDANRLLNDYGVLCTSLLDIRFVVLQHAHFGLHPCGPKTGLRTLALKLFGIEEDESLDIYRICSNWYKRKLDPGQIAYAARDSMLCCDILYYCAPGVYSSLRDVTGDSPPPPLSELFCDLFSLNAKHLRCKCYEPRFYRDDQTKHKSLKKQSQLLKKKPTAADHNNEETDSTSSDDDWDAHVGENETTEDVLNSIFGCWGEEDVRPSNVEPSDEAKKIITERLLIWKEKFEQCRDVALLPDHVFLPSMTFLEFLTENGMRIDVWDAEPDTCISNYRIRWINVNAMVSPSPELHEHVSSGYSSSGSSPLFTVNNSNNNAMHTSETIKTEEPLSEIAESATETELNLNLNQDWGGARPQRLMMVKPKVLKTRRDRGLDRSRRMDYESPPLIDLSSLAVTNGNENTAFAVASNLPSNSNPMVSFQPISVEADDLQYPYLVKCMGQNADSVAQQSTSGFSKTFKWPNPLPKGKCYCINTETSTQEEPSGLDRVPLPLSQLMMDYDHGVPPGLVEPLVPFNATSLLPSSSMPLTSGFLTLQQPIISSLPVLYPKQDLQCTSNNGSSELATTDLILTSTYCLSPPVYSNSDILYTSAVTSSALNPYFCSVATQTVSKSITFQDDFNYQASTDVSLLPLPPYEVSECFNANITPPPPPTPVDFAFSTHQPTTGLVTARYYENCASFRGYVDPFQPLTQLKRTVLN